MTAEADVLPRGSLRRALLAALALAMLALCCSSGHYRVYDAAAVQAEAGKALACDPLVIRFAEQPPGYPTYLAQGCGRSMRLECWDSADGVACHPAEKSDVTSSSSTDDDRGEPSAGCGCGHLFGGHHSSAAPHSSQETKPASAPPSHMQYGHSSPPQEAHHGGHDSGGCGCGHFSHDNHAPSSPTKR